MGRQPRHLPSEPLWFCDFSFAPFIDVGIIGYWKPSPFDEAAVFNSQLPEAFIWKKQCPASHEHEVLLIYFRRRAKPDMALFQSETTEVAPRALSIQTTAKRVKIHLRRRCPHVNALDGYLWHLTSEGKSSAMEWQRRTDTEDRDTNGDAVDPAVVGQPARSSSSSRLFDQAVLEIEIE